MLKMIVVVILNYNDGKNCLKVANRALENINIDKAIIVDNCSPDNSYSLLKKQESENLIVLKTDKNGGFAYGNNFGINYAIKRYNPKIVITINSDIIIENNVIDANIDFLEKHKEYGLVSCAIREQNGELSERPCWSYPSLKDMIMYCGWITRKFYKAKKTEIKDCEYMDVDVVRGSFMCFNVQALKLIGGFDENTFLYNEENIISQRLKKMGYKVAFLPRYEYFHNHRVSDKKRIVDLSPGLNSGYYYATNYGGVKGIKKEILRFCTLVGIGENYMINRIKKHYMKN